jgi:putative endonuclease
MKQPAVYILASKRNGTLYTGVTSDLVKRVWEHRESVVDGFTKRYGCKMLVWYELGGGMAGAIMREKQIKGGSRASKLALIESSNPEWRDLWHDVAHP